MVGRQGKGSAEREAEECGAKEGQDTVPLAVHTTVGSGESHLGKQERVDGTGNNSGTVPAHRHG